MEFRFKLKHNTMSTAEIGDLVGRILATAFLAVACAGIWAVAEFIVFTMQWKRTKKKEKK